MFPNRHPSGILKSITPEARCKATTESCIQPSNHMNVFITTGNPLNIKYWINIQQLCWCFLRFGSELSPLRRTLTEWATTLSGKISKWRASLALRQTHHTQPEGNGATQQDHRLGDEAAAAFQPLRTQSATLYLHGWPKRKHVLELLPTQTYPLTFLLACL